MKTILCTGGAGFIGSHTVVELANTGRYKVLIVDNLANSCKEATDAIIKLCPAGSTTFHNIDIVNDVDALKKLSFDGVIHFAALKSVGESVAKPLVYYRNNLIGMVNVIETAAAVNAKCFIFSSSATVYKPSEELLSEEHGLCPSNPYGQTKLMGEQILKDTFVSDPTWRIMNLRYFNPVGAHPSGSIGENASIASNIMPAIHRALFNGQTLMITGTDFSTRDGTGVRDYIHVMDIADGHIKALDAAFNLKEGGIKCYNLGSGKGVSVLELVNAFEKASGRTINRSNAPRRPGDLATVVADGSKASKEIGFTPTRSIEQACKDSWKWMESHPNGYSK